MSAVNIQGEIFVSLVKNLKWSIRRGLQRCPNRIMQDKQEGHLAEKECGDYLCVVL